MNIKQASEAKRGVRPEHPLLRKRRASYIRHGRPGNDYRDYTEQDIRTLRFIRMLRMLDVPLPVIRSVLAGDASLGSVLREQKTALEQRAKQLEGAARFCAELARQDPSVASLDVDACLSRMEDPAQPQNFFCGWVQDYRTLAQVQHQKHFFFIPEGSINTPQEFTAALQTYAKANGMQLSLTKEGMYPEFSLDGILYKAYRNPGKYRDEICCDAASPEQLNTGLPSRREQQLLRIAAYRAAARCSPLPPFWRQAGWRPAERTGSGWQHWQRQGSCLAAALNTGCNWASLLSLAAELRPPSERCSRCLHTTG